MVNKRAMRVAAFLAVSGSIFALANAMDTDTSAVDAQNRNASRGSVDAMAIPLVAAHRGGFFQGQGGLYRIQRTVAEADADIIEVDLRATLDQQVVVFHDRRMDHRSTCSGSVESRRYEELAACHLRNAGAPLPRFSEILAIARGRAIVDAEFKTEAAIAPAIQMVIATGAVNAVYFQLGSNRERYRQVRAYSPDISVQFKATSDDDLDWALSRGDAHLRIIEMDRDFLDADRIARVHAAGKLVSANTWRYQ